MALPFQYPEFKEMPMPQPFYPSVSNGNMHSNTYMYEQTSYMIQSSLATEESNDMEEIVKNLMILMNNATKEELQQVLDNEDKVNELIQDAEQTKKLRRKLKDLLQLNKDLAVTNTSMQPEFEITKENLLSLVKEQKELRDKYDFIYQKIASKLSLDSTLSILHAATAEKESESEETSSALLNKNINVDEFIEQFIPKRKHYHLRKIKAEKLSQILQKRSNRSFPVPPPRLFVNNGYGGY
ncbi:vacuolar protein sorting-associated protein 37 isoform X1 [Hydra vulgaris]|uniref:vacuolar protein sorting-associated protein 37 isoform X1 n=1 Tax=Hydra vulgaris TaxID=6087 RepID=UPI0006413809|nr:vacuolar protein sorting-associated protein 37 [Hydra vulgaris]